VRFSRIEEITMKFFPVVSTTAFLTILCLVASRSPASAFPTDSRKAQENVIYHQTMTPTWLEEQASYIDSSHTKTTKQLRFNSGSVNRAALLKVPMIPAGVLQYSAPLTVKIVVSHDVSIGTTQDSDISYGVSDGIAVVGITTRDKFTYTSSSPCHGFESTSGTTLSQHGWINYSSPKVSDSFYPGQFVITLKLDERWGSCYTAHDGGFVKTTSYTKRLMLNKGLTLEVYKQNAGEKVGIKYIEVTVLQDA